MSANEYTSMPYDYAKKILIEKIFAKDVAINAHPALFKERGYMAWLMKS